MDKYISVKDLEDGAALVLPKAARDYYKSGATDEQTLSENRVAFQRLRLRPRCLVGITGCDLRTKVLGNTVSMPVGLSPTAMQRMAHPEGELASARAAQAEGTIYTLSTISTSSIEEVADAAPDAIKWFQLYIYKDREVTKNLVLRAERAGFKAIALTVDTPMFGLRRADVRNKFSLPSHLRFSIDVEYLLNRLKLEMGDRGGQSESGSVFPLSAAELKPHGGLLVDRGTISIHDIECNITRLCLPGGAVGLANFEGHLSTKIQSSEKGSGLNEYVQNLFDKNLTWDEVKWLKSITNLPIIAKGILRGDDALKAVEAGCSAILVSNHGARQLDGVPATIEALPEVIEAVKDFNVEVYLDGGVTTGTDVYKALTLGAQMVFVGRPVLWGLAVGGQAGVQKMLDIFRTELEYTFQIAGTPTVADISKDMVRHESTYSRL